MKNLENFGVQELNAREIGDFQGGFIPIVWGAYVLLSAGTVKTLFVAGLSIGTAAAVAAVASD